MVFLSRIFLVLIICLSTCRAQNLSIEQMLDAPFPSALVSSPFTDAVAWVYNHNGVRNIWLAEGDSFKERQITQYDKDDGQEINSLIFTAQSSEIIYVKGGPPNRQGEIPNPTSNPQKAQREIWIISKKGTNQRKISNGSSPTISPDGKILAFIKQGSVWVTSIEESNQPKQFFSIRGGVSSLTWSPDGKKMAFVSNRGDHSFIGIYDQQSNHIEYINPSVDNDNNPVWSPDGTQLAYMRLASEKKVLPFAPRRAGLSWSIMIADIETYSVRELWKASKGQGSVYRFISANSQLFWTAENSIIFPWEGDGWTHLYELSAEGGEATCLTPGNFEVQFASISHDKTSIFYSSNEGDIDRQHIWKVNSGNHKPQSMTKGEGIEWSPVATKSGRLFCIGSSGRVPAHINRISSKEKLVPLRDLSDYPSDKLVDPEQIIFTSADGMKIHGQLFRPKNAKQNEQHPALLFFHGGSRRQMLLGFHHRGYYHNSYAMNQYLASKGYIVLSVNYRSGIGYGMKFREALNYGAQGASEFNDVLGAGIYLQNRKDVDETKIGLWGGSYGGYLTALGLARASNLFAAGVDIHGVHDWNVVIKNFVPNYIASERPRFSQLAYQSSPIAYLNGWKSPVLLIHGDDDRNVPFSETVELVESLRNEGVYFEQLVFPDEVHGFLLHKNWISAYKSTADFFDRMLLKKK